MNATNRNPTAGRAVSPVVGVVLMVGVTVALAGMTGTFLLGFADVLQESPQAGVSYDGERLVPGSIVDSPSTLHRFDRSIRTRPSGSRRPGTEGRREEGGTPKNYARGLRRWGLRGS